MINNDKQVYRLVQKFIYNQKVQKNYQQNQDESWSERQKVKHTRVSLMVSRTSLPHEFYQWRRQRHAPIITQLSCSSLYLLRLLAAAAAIPTLPASC